MFNVAIATELWLSASRDLKESVKSCNNFHRSPSIQPRSLAYSVLDKNLVARRPLWNYNQLFSLRTSLSYSRDALRGRNPRQKPFCVKITATHVCCIIHDAKTRVWVLSLAAPPHFSPDVEKLRGPPFWKWLHVILKRRLRLGCLYSGNNVFRVLHT